MTDSIFAQEPMDEFVEFDSTYARDYGNWHYRGVDSWVPCSQEMCRLLDALKKKGKISWTNGMAKIG